MALVILNFFEISNQVRTATSTLMQPPEIFVHRFTLARKLYELSAYFDLLRRVCCCGLKAQNERGLQLSRVMRPRKG